MTAQKRENRQHPVGERCRFFIRLATVPDSLSGFAL